MDGHDRARAGRDGALGGRDVERIRRRVDVDEDRGRAHHQDRGRGSDKRERRRDDLVAGADPERRERQPERVGARRDAERPADAAQGRQLALQRLTFGAEDELARVEDARDGGAQLLPERRVLAGQVDERDHLNLGPESKVLAPTFELRTFPSPSRCSEKRNSSSAVCPVAMSRLRLTYSALNAQQSNLKSSPKWLSTKVSVRRSQFVLIFKVRFLQTSTESPPWRKWMDGESPAPLNVPG